MLTENKINLIHAIADADLGEEFAYKAVSILEEEQMPIITEYINGELKEGEEITANKRHKRSKKTETGGCTLLSLSSIVPCNFTL